MQLVWQAAFAVPMRSLGTLAGVNAQTDKGVTAFNMKNLWAVLAALVAILVACPSYASDRDPAVRKSFQRSHPCPANGRTKGACPGYVVDHVKPLCAAGADSTKNMQWQTVAEAKKKDRLEAQECRGRRNRRA